MQTNYSALRTEELIALRKELENKIASLDAMQMAKKIQMNALYGAL